MGLLEQAGNVFEDSEFLELKHSYSGNTELFINQSRELYPRSENDSFGMLIRAIAEVIAENYNEAAKYFKLTKIFGTESQRIYSYIQVGETEAAQALLDKRKAAISFRLDAEIEYWGSAPIEVDAMEISYLEEDIQKAMANLKKAMNKTYIIGNYYITNPMFKKLRQHPDWSALLEESDKRAAVQREIYLKLVAENDKTSL